MLVGAVISVGTPASSASAVPSLASSTGSHAPASATTGSARADASYTAAASKRPRVIVMTDGEVDDRSSMVRFLMYSSDVDVEGIVQVNSRWQQHGHSDEGWVDEVYSNYEKVLPNLRVHNRNYPSVDYLKSVTRVGNETQADLMLPPADMATKNTPGEQLIIQKLLSPDPRPIQFECWGGCNTLASALWTLKTHYSERDYERAAAKTWVYGIWYQDDGGRWIQNHVPKAHVFETFQWTNVWNYGSLTGPAPQDVKDHMTSTWLDTNVKTGHGPLGAYYPQSYVSEGDSVSFLPNVANGLQDAAFDFTLPSWGGRGVTDAPCLTPNHYTDYTLQDDGDAKKLYWRWIPAAQNDFAARMDWAVAKNYRDANHAPIAQAADALRRTVRPGATVTMNVSPSSDPDGDRLSYSFWQYGDADSASSNVSIVNSKKAKASFKVPNEPGKQIQVIAEVTDNGTPALTSYKRYIFTIGKSASQPTCPARDAVSWSSPKGISSVGDVSTKGTLVRAARLTADAAGYNTATTVNGVKFEAAPFVADTTNLANGDTIVSTDNATRGASTGFGGDDAAPFSALASEYKALLRTGYYNEAPTDVTAISNNVKERAGETLTLNNLKVGQKYELQVWVNDYRIGATGSNPKPDFTTVLDDGNRRVVLQQNAQNVQGGTGQYVTGTFVATAATKTFNLAGSNARESSNNRSAVFNAYQLRALPR
ncbi:nucleoside hydrolase-like domain-containing protein [Streptomyces sp. NPDC003343]